MNTNFEDEQGESIIWLAFWCNEGFEGLINVSDYINNGKKELIEKIKTGQEPKRSAERDLNSIIHGMTIRARFNPERHYELYTFNAGSNMSEETIKEWFDNSPQSAVDWIRKNGTPIVKKSVATSKPVID